jgi:hydroxymethylglutaryl-CoA lyase
VELPARATLREVGPRDGLQSIDGVVATADKVAIVDALTDAGLARIEVTSFVRASAVPQMADASDVMARIRRAPGTSYEALVPNERGARDAIGAGVDAVVVIVATSEAFGQRNVGMSIADALEQLERISGLADEVGVRCLASVTTAFGCAYEGPIPTERVFSVVDRCLELGIDEVTLCDTMGLANPAQVDALARAVRDQLAGRARLGLHFHNTRGLGLANVLAGLEAGVDLFDASVGGIGGCPFAPGATGNVSSEDVVHMFEELGVATEPRLEALLLAAADAERRLGFRLPGQVLRAGSTSAAFVRAAERSEAS